VKITLRFPDEQSGNDFIDSVLENSGVIVGIEYETPVDAVPIVKTAVIEYIEGQG